MLDESEIREIQRQAGHYEQKRAACIEALKIVQRGRGWVADEAVREIAGLLGMSPHEVDSVATFYNLIYREPVGRHVIHLCDSVSCWVMGCDRVRACLEEKLGIQIGDTTEDGRFTLLPIPCLGTCDHAPAMLVGEELHRDLTTEKIESILEAHE